MITGLEEFGRRHQISQKTIYRLQMVFEEMCMQILLPRMQESFTLLVTASYSQKEDKATMRIRYSGKAVDLGQEDNALPMKLVEHAAESIECLAIHEGEMTNQINIVIR